jgi:translocation and assembly module TamB
VKWKRIIVWAFVVLVVVVVGLPITSLLVVKFSPSARREILARVERNVSRSIGTQVSIRDFKLSLSRRSLQLDGIVVRGRGPQFAPPLLEIERVAVEIKIDSVLGRQWRLQNLLIHHPTVHIFMDKNGEAEESPPQAIPGSGISSIFDLAVRKCLIDGGQIFYKDTKRHLEAEIYDLHLNAQIDPTLRRYNGALSYDHAQIQYADYLPAVHDLHLNFTLTPAELMLDRLEVGTGQSRIVATGLIKDFRSPAVTATYDAELWTDDLRRLLRQSSLPEGIVHTTGSFTYQGLRNRPFLQSAMLAGDLSSTVVQVRMQATRAEVRNIRASYKLADGNLEIRDMSAQTMGGILKGRLTIHDVAGVSRTRLKAHLQDLSLEELEATAHEYKLPEAHLSGKINADADATWGQTLASLATHIDATLEGALGRKQSAPLKAVIHANYTAANHEIELRQSYIRTTETSIELNGKVSRYSQLQVAARSNNLHELELIAANLRTALSGAATPTLDLYGAASFSGVVTGLVMEPRIQGKLDAHTLRVKGSSWKVVSANIDASSSALKVSNGYLESANSGKIRFTLRTKLERWAYTPASPIDLEIAMSRISVSELERVANQTYPISGTLSANVSVRGSQINPVGHGDITLVGGKIASEPLQLLTVKFQGTGNEVHANLLAHLLAGAVQAQVTLDPASRAYQAHIQTENMRLEHLQAVRQRKLPITGNARLEARGNGTFSTPEWNATLKVSELRIQDQIIHELTLTTGIKNRIANITLDSSVAQTPFKGYGTVRIDPPYAADLQLDAVRFSLQPLLALYIPTYSGKIRGQAEIHAFLRGPLQDAKLLEGRLDIPLLTASYQQFQLGVTKPIHADYRNGLLKLQPISLEGTGTKIQMEATVPVEHPSTATYLVHGMVDLGLARMLNPDLRGEGQIQIDLDSRRQLPGSDWIGEVRIVNASLHMADVPIGLDNGNAALVFSPTRMEVKSLQGEVGGGRIEGGGTVSFRPAIQFDLRLSGTNIRLRYPEGVRSVLESRLTLAGNKQESTLAGFVNIQSLSLTPNFDLSTFTSRIGEEVPSPPPTSFMQHLRLNIDVQSAAPVNAVSAKLSFGGNANLRLAGTAAEPVILGRANLNGGDFFFGGNRYVLQTGTIEFVNPLQTEAVVNAQVKTKVDQYDITLNLQGPMGRLNTTYTSEPPLPPVDIINLLAFGHTTAATGANPATPGNLGVQSALVQGLGTAVGSRVEKFAGLSYFSIDPTLGGSNQNAGARVVIQERVTSNLVVTYSTDVTSTRRQAIQLEYRFNPRWSVSGVRDQNGGFGVTASHRRSF